MHTQILLSWVQKSVKAAMQRILSEVKSCSGGSWGRICYNEAKTFPSDPVTLKSLYNQKSNNGTSRSCLVNLGLYSCFRGQWLHRLELHWLPDVSRMALLTPHMSVFHQMSPTFGGKANIFRMIRDFKELRSTTVKALEDIFHFVPFLSLPYGPAVITSSRVWMIMGVG